VSMTNPTNHVEIITSVQRRRLRLAEGWTLEQIAGWLKGGNEPRLRAVGCETVYAFIYRAAQQALACAESRLPRSAYFVECDPIFGVGRARSVHKAGYGHNRDGAAA
jgi:IS30 family transposase